MHRNYKCVISRKEDPQLKNENYNNHPKTFNNESQQQCRSVLVFKQCYFSYFIFRLIIHAADSSLAEGNVFLMRGETPRRF